MASDSEPRFRYLMQRSGESAGARMGGVFMLDEDIQSQDVRDLALDLARFIKQTAKGLPRK